MVSVVYLLSANCFIKFCDGGTARNEEEQLCSVENGVFCTWLDRIEVLLKRARVLTNELFAVSSLRSPGAKPSDDGLYMHGGGVEAQSCLERALIS